MSSYEGFAHLYDALTFDVNYNEIADFLCQRLQANGITNGLVLDLACGTGTLTLALSQKGYEMLGADASEDMLSVARQKEGAENILFLNQPMEDFELYGTVDAIVCVLDSINYLTEPGALEKTFALCANYLNPDGVLIFDVNSEYKFRQVLAQETYTYETDDIFYIWENDYNEESDLCHLYLTFFEETENGLYRRLDEVHTQRLYTDSHLQNALNAAGLTVTACYDGYTKDKPKSDSERIVYEVKKK
ncbi:MAG: class I SAM-dependent methyltransferase [Clostridia bacterium]|nr:class I SAM-dependent methyltransferase [Clostridia bacterium]